MTLGKSLGKKFNPNREPKYRDGSFKVGRDDKPWIAEKPIARPGQSDQGKNIPHQDSKNPGLRDMMFREGRDDQGGPITNLPAYPGMEDRSRIRPLPAQLPNDVYLGGETSQENPNQANDGRLDGLLQGLLSW